MAGKVVPRRIFKDFFRILPRNVISRSLSSADDSDPASSKSGARYRIFQDAEAPVILDVTEERRRERQNIESRTTQPPPSYRRGVTGVFDIEELVETLREENARDIFVVKVAKELKYVDHLVVVSCGSRRQLLGIAEHVRSVYKKKRHDHDSIPHIEGETSTEWIAMDLGNIALHVMSSSAREKYDLESLWALGPGLDLKLQSAGLDVENSLQELMKRHSVVLEDLRPLQTS